MTVNESLQTGYSRWLCRMETSRLCANVCVELEPSEVGLVEVGSDDAFSFSLLVEDEQR